MNYDAEQTRLVTRDDYEMALIQINALMDGDPESDSTEGKELERLSAMIGRYEDRIYSDDL